MTSPAESTQMVSLLMTDSGPIHDAIQPHGAMVVTDLNLDHIVQISDNLRRVLGLEATAALPDTLLQLLGKRTTLALRRELRHQDCLPGALVLQRRAQAKAQRLQVFAFRSGQHTVVELEPLAGSAGRRLLPSLNVWVSQLANTAAEPELLQKLTETVRQLTGFDRVSVCELDAEGGGAITAESRNGHLPPMLGQGFPAQTIPRYARRILMHNPVRSIADLDAHPARLCPSDSQNSTTPLDLTLGFLRHVSPTHRSWLTSMGVGATLTIAMRGENQVWGLLLCHRAQPSSLSPTLREAARTLVEIATQRLFLLRARAEALYLERVQDSRDLLSSARGELRGPEELVALHGGEWLDLFRADGLALVHHDAIYQLGHAPNETVIERITVWLRRHRASVGFWASRSAQEGPLAHEADANEWAGLMAIALAVDPLAPGWLLFFRRGAHDQVVPPWVTLERRAARDLAEDLAVSVAAQEIRNLNDHLAEERARLAELNRRLERQAHTDPLTGIWNRYRIEQALDLELAAGQRYGRPGTALLLDIDHFKEINDRHGHGVGDQVLAAWAKSLQETLRPTDYLGRWGGEEFIIILSQTDHRRAMVVAERLRQRLANQSFPVVGQVTASIGVAAGRTGDTRRSWVDRADRALYLAKREGRNCVRSEPSSLLDTV